MIKVKYLFYILFLLAIYSCTRSIFSSMSWQSIPVVIDGNMNEWPNPLRFYDSKSKVNYSITNDRKNLYVCLKVSDELTQFRIMEGGMELSMDTSDKNKYPVKVIYPPGNVEKINNELKQNKKRSENFDALITKQIFLGLLKELEVKGFKYPVSGNILLNNSYGISVSINWDKSGVMIYEAKLPFATFYKDELDSVDTNKVISFKVRINALPVSEESKISKNSQDDNNIIGKGSMNGSINDGLNSNIYGTGAGGYGNNNHQNTGISINPVSEPLEFKIKMKFSYQ